MTLDNISRNGLILGAFTLVTTLLITLTYWLTSPIIAQQQQQKILQTLTEVLPADKWDNDLANNCIIVSDSPLGKGPHKIYRAWLGDKPSALVMESTTAQGYSGNIKFLVSLMDASVVGGVRVLQHKETPGLGDKIELRISDWILDFSGETREASTREDWAVRKDGGKFDQFTGATITPRAMVTGVQTAISWGVENYQQSFSANNACGDEDATIASPTNDKTNADHQETENP